METSWPYVTDWRGGSEEIALTFADCRLTLNDIKDRKIPSLRCWSTAGCAGRVPHMPGTDGAVPPDISQSPLLPSSGKSDPSARRFSLNVGFVMWQRSAQILCPFSINMTIATLALQLAGCVDHALTNDHVT